MKKTMKIVSVLLMVVMLTMTLSTVVMATNVNNIIDTMSNSKANNTTGISKIGGQIADTLTTIGIVIAVIVILILGIKYMIGSASEKAEYKKTMIPYIVGAVLLLGGSSIVKLIFNSLKVVA